MRRDPVRMAGVARNATVGALLGLGLLLSNWPARAVDGVIEINQAAALAGGITPCDQPGFPVSLCASGSYRLTSNLTYSSGSGINLDAPDIHLDLNGMTVQGPATCVTGAGGFVTSCTGIPNPGREAIRSSSARATVRNGTVRGAEYTCISLDGDSGVIEDLVLTGCGDSGVDLGGNATASNIKVIGVRSAGIVTGGNLRARDVRVVNNGTYGISAGVGSEITDVIANNNATGVDVSFWSVLKNAVAAGNRSDGIVVGIGSIVDTFSVTLNGGSGVNLRDGSLARAGVARDNGTTSNVACALQGQGGAAYREVVITSVNGGNSVTACGLVNLGNNTCMGASCPP